MCHFFKTIFFILLSLGWLQAQSPQILVTNLPLHSIISYLVEGIDQPAMLESEIDAHEQVQLIQARILFMDGRTESLTPYVQLYFSRPHQKIYDIQHLKGVELTNFIYWPQHMRIIVPQLAAILEKEFPEHAKNIRDNLLYFQKELNRFHGKATRYEFFDYVRTEDILHMNALDRYFNILTKLGLLAGTRGDTH